MSVREQMLEAAKRCVMQDRNIDYSDPEDNFQAIADMWNAYWRAVKTQRHEPELSAHDVAVFEAIVKISRIATSPEKHDHWIDLAGYAACGAECAVDEPRGTWGGDPAPAKNPNSLAETRRRPRDGGR